MRVGKNTWCDGKSTENLVQMDLDNKVNICIRCI